MRISKATVFRGMAVLVILSVAAIFSYRSIRKTCCTEDFTEVQLQHLVSDAQGGNVTAMKRLYRFFAEGEDTATARYWLKRAADAGDAESELFMYDRLFASKNVKDKELGVRYLVRAAEHGEPTAQVVLGESYRDGSGVPKSIDHARYWLRRSALTGDEDGVLALCELALSQGDRKQCEECLKLDTQALTSLDRQSYLAKELVTQHEQIESRLRDWNGSAK